MLTNVSRWMTGARRALRVAGLSGLCLCSAATAQANEPAPGTPPPGEVTQGGLLIERADGVWQPAPTIDTAVEMHVAGIVARVSVLQRFTNHESGWVNGIYAFPLPETAAVDHLRVEVGARIIEGRIEPRAEARRLYAQAARSGRKASLVEQQRPNLFTNRVANIGPGETVTVRIEYQETVRYDAGRYSLRFPLTLGIRYIPGRPVAGADDGGGWAANTDQVPDASHVTPPVTRAGDGHDNPVSIAVELDAGFPLAELTSTYHTIRQQRLGPYRHQLTLAAGTVPADRDFELVWRAAPQSTPRVAWFTQTRADERYGLLMLMPPDLEGGATPALPREVTFVIDTSGSMEGQSLPQAKAALTYALSRLGVQDRFNVVEFNSVVRKFAPASVVADPAQLARAAEFVRGLYATGGTEIAAALDAVLDGRTDSGKLRQVVFLTDGSVGNERALLDHIDTRRGDVRLFTIGIGSAPNSYFMREAAASGRGSYRYIGAVDEVEARMRELFDQLARPVLADLKLVAEDGHTPDYAPDPLADLYAHEPLVVSIKLDRATTALSVQGRLRDQAWSTRVPLTAASAARGLDVLWARQRIAGLERSLGRGADRGQVAEQITALGLAFHLVTPHTSLVAVDVTPTRIGDPPALDRAVPVKRPHGWDMDVPTPRLPQTATPLALHGLIGLLSLLGACVSGLLRWRTCRRRAA